MSQALIELLEDTRAKAKDSLIITKNCSITPDAAKKIVLFLKENEIKNLVFESGISTTEEAMNIFTTELQNSKNLAISSITYPLNIIENGGKIVSKLMTYAAMTKILGGQEVVINSCSKLGLSFEGYDEADN